MTRSGRFDQTFFFVPDFEKALYPAVFVDKAQGKVILSSRINLDLLRPTGV